MSAVVSPPNFNTPSEKKKKYEFKKQQKQQCISAQTLKAIDAVISKKLDRKASQSIFANI